MIGLDSNVVVRYLTQDDAVQSRKANELIDGALRSGKALFLNHIVLCEMSWVLSRAYDCDRKALAVVIEKLLGTAQFEFEDKSALWTALEEFRRSSADFADCLIGVKNAGAGCSSTLTFDKSAGKLPQFSHS